MIDETLMERWSSAKSSKNPVDCLRVAEDLMVYSLKLVEQLDDSNVHEKLAEIEGLVDMMVEVEIAGDLPPTPLRSLESVGEFVQ